MKTLWVVGLVLGLAGVGHADDAWQDSGQNEKIIYAEEGVRSEISLFNKRPVEKKVINDINSLNALLGTWIISYSRDSVFHTDRLEATEIFTDPSSGNKFVKSKLFNDQKGDGTLYLCTYDPDAYYGASGDYGCVTVDQYGFNVQVYVFKFSNNAIVDGNYGSGFGSNGAAFDAVLKGKKLTGYRVTPSRYQSNYDLIKWDARGFGTDFCIDITDINYKVINGYQALRCGKDMIDFSPVDYVANVMRTYLPSGYRFGWKVWFRNNIGMTWYGGAGYEGIVTVP